MSTPRMRTGTPFNARACPRSASNAAWAHAPASRALTGLPFGVGPIRPRPTWACPGDAGRCPLRARTSCTNAWSPPSAGSTCGGCSTKGVPAAARPAQAGRRRPAAANHPAAPPLPVAAPPPPRHRGFLRCPAHHGEGVRGPAVHAATPPGPGPESEGPRTLLPVHPLRSEPGPDPVGVLPGQGGAVRLPVHAAHPALVRRQAGPGRPGPRPRTPLQGPTDTPVDAVLAPALDQFAQAESR